MTKTRQIKILIIAPALDRFLGGQAVQAARLREKLDDEPNLQVDIQSIGPRFLPRLQNIKYVRTVVTTLKFWFDILVKIPKYDVIHVFSAAHFSFLLAPMPAVLVARLFGKKTVLHYHSGEIQKHFDNWSRTLKPTLRLFDKIVVPSSYLVEKFAEYGFQTQAIYNVIDIDNFPFRLRKPLRPVFLSNRLLEELYNVGCILRAFAVIRKNYPLAQLIVAGFGERRENLENLARELKLENIEFTGKIAPEKMAQLYDKTDIYLNAPNADNMPGSIIESYAAGLPVVSTDAGGIPFILEHETTGLTVKINDHEALAREAMRLLEDEKLAARLVENARRYCRQFSWEKIRLEWLDVYGELTGENVDKPRG